MQPKDSTSASRRRLLNALAAIPALLGVKYPVFANVSSPSSSAAAPITVDQVLNVAEFEGLARARLPVAHFGFIATGVDDDRTVSLNHDAYRHIEIRARRFVDVSHVDMTRRILGSTWAQPIYLSAVSGMRAFHPDAELAAARAAASQNMQMMLSTGSSCPLEEVIAARAAPVWQQLYATDDWSVTEAIVRRAQKAGATAIVLTVDSPPGRNNETLYRAMRSDHRDCNQCHVGGSHDMVRRAPMFQGIDVSRVKELSPSSMSQAFLDRLRELVTVKLLVKGIVTGEDAAIALNHGVDGIVVSNHGGRNEETLRSTIECLPEIVAAAAGRVPVFIDGGVRRGTDIFKALALGAAAVGIGRPSAWGLAAFGQPGVEAVGSILTRELRDIMRHAGTPDLKTIDQNYVTWSKF